MSQAKAAAGDKDVLVHRAAVAQLTLGADVLGEIELHLIPVLSVQRPSFDLRIERPRTPEGSSVGGVWVCTHMHQTSDDYAGVQTFGGTPRPVHCHKVLDFTIVE